MKKSFLFCGFFLYSITGFTQNTFPTAANTNVGIGTTSPSTRLQITSASSGTSGVRLTNLTSSTATTTGNGKALSVDSSGNIILTPVLNTATSSTNIYNTNGSLSSARTVSLNNFSLNFNSTTAGGNLFINGTTGNVGIGNINPTSKLDINGTLKGNQAIFTSDLSDGVSFTSYGERNDKCLVLGVARSIGTGSGYLNTRMFNFFDFPVSNLDAKSSFLFSIEDRSDYGRFRVTGETGGLTSLSLLDKTQMEVFKVFDDGNNRTVLSLAKSDSYLGIGTTNFIDGTDVYRLSVKGSIRADRVKVYTTWADYVFQKDYNLPTLKEVESYIKKNGHLKDIPSAKEVENNGIELGEMNKLLLQKIEELTLYIIEMKKEIDTLNLKLKNE